MSSPFEVRCLLSHGSVMVTDILHTMCHVITDDTANHRPSSRKVRILPVRQFAVRQIPTPTPYSEENCGTLGMWWEQTISAPPSFTAVLQAQGNVEYH